MSTPVRSCPECQLDLNPIKLIDATGRASGDEKPSRVELSYALEDAQAPLRGFFGIAPRGAVQGYICGKCGRILLYAQPR